MEHFLNKWASDSLTWISKDVSLTITVQKMKFPIKDFFSKCDQIRNRKPHFLYSISEDISLTINTLSGDSSQESVSTQNQTVCRFGNIKLPIQNLCWIPPFFKFLCCCNPTTRCFSTYYKKQEEMAGAFFLYDYILIN